MNEFAILIWLITWIVFLIMSTFERRGSVFGFMAGLWAVFFGIAIHLTGIQVKSGMVLSNVNSSQTFVYQYTNLVMPFSSYSFLWGIPFILLGLYICFLAVTK